MSTGQVITLHFKILRSQVIYGGINGAFIICISDLYKLLPYMLAYIKKLK